MFRNNDFRKFIIFCVFICLNNITFGQIQVETISKNYTWFGSKDDKKGTWFASAGDGWMLYKNDSLKTFKREDHDSGLRGTFIQSHLYPIQEGAISSTYEFLNFYSEKDDIFSSCKIVSPNGNEYATEYKVFYTDTLLHLVLVKAENDLFWYDYRHHAIKSIIDTSANVANVYYDPLTKVIIASKWAYGPGAILYKYSGQKIVKEFLFPSEQVYPQKNIISYDAIIVASSIYFATNNGLYIYNLKDESFILHPETRGKTIRSLTSYSDIVIFTLDKSIVKLYYTTLGQTKDLFLNRAEITEFSIIESMYIQERERVPYLMLSVKNKGIYSLNIHNFLQTDLLKSDINTTKYCILNKHIYAIQNNFLKKYNLEFKRLAQYNLSKWNTNERNVKSLDTCGGHLIMFCQNKCLIFTESLSMIKTIKKKEESFSRFSCLNDKIAISVPSQRNHVISSLKGSGHTYHEHPDASILYYVQHAGGIYYINENGLMDAKYNTVNHCQTGLPNQIVPTPFGVLIAAQNGAYIFNNNMCHKLSEKYPKIAEGLDNFAFSISGHRNDKIFVQSGSDILKYGTTIQRCVFEQKLSVDNTRIFNIDSLIFFSSANNLHRINTKIWEYQNQNPSIKLISINLNGNIVPLTNRIIVKRKFENLQFKFKISEKVTDDKNNLFYRIKSNDTSWTKENTKIITIKSLSAGVHTLEVICRGSTFNYSEIKKIIIDVLPPIYQRWWFIILCGMVFISLGFGLNFLKTRDKLRKQKLALEKLMALQDQRERLARDLHDEIGSGLSKIKFMTSEVSSEMNSKKDIQQLSTSLLDSMRDMLWSLDTTNDKLSDLISKIRMSSQILIKNTALNLRISNNDIDSDVEIAGIVRRNLLLIIKEAIHNILKHANAKQIIIDIFIHNNCLVLKIADDGQGIGKSILNKQKDQYGLNSMEKRAKDIGASFKIEDNLPGTKITIIYPFIK